jgi:hypothetical protein
MRSAPLLAALAVAFVLDSCASGPETGSTSPVTCDLPSSREISFLTTTRSNNPFLPISGLLRGTADEFVVVRIRLFLPDSTIVAVDGSVNDETGAEVAKLQTYTQMAKYWDIAEDLPPRDVQARSDALQRYYPMDAQFKARKGRSEYIVVFKGKNPLPRPATVALTVILNGEPQDFTFPLLPVKK